MEKCKFYELDTYLKETEDQLLEAYGPAPDIPEQDRPARPEILDQCCGQLCKWMVIGEGFPGEECYCCTNPDCPHNGIIYIDFDESAVI